MDDGTTVAGKELKPWEQHSQVLSIPRFDYNAPSSLLNRPHSGFLVTCPIKREKSATKEAIAILEKHMKGHGGGCGMSDSEQDTKKRKLCTEGMENESLYKAEEKDAFDATGSHGNLVASADTDGVTLAKSCLVRDNLSLVKLKKNGLLLFTFPEDSQNCAVNILSRILCSLESGDLKRPEWCFRIFPIQETCILKEKDLCNVVSKLVRDFLSGEGSKLEKPIKLIVRIELLPISGLPSGSLVAGVSVLPKTLLSIKSRGICVKALLSDTKLIKHG